MSDRFYKIGNTWYPWQTAHGLYGYTKTPTIRITYISTSQATWGQPESGYGFFDGDASEPQNGSYFHTSTWGWFDADTMAKTIWLMPSECEIDDIFFENDGEISPGARLVIDPSVSIDEEDWRYLIASVRNLGWHTLDEWEELGWVLSDPNTLYFGGDFSGNNIRIESVDGGGGLIDKFASYHALFDLRGWEPGGLFIDKPRMMGICGVLTETSDSVVLVEVAKQLSVGRIEFTASLAEGGIPVSGVMYEGTIIGGIVTQYYDLYFTANMNNLIGVVEEYDPRPSIEINLGIRFDPSNAQWLAKTFDADEWWWSGILSSSDLSALRNFGCGYLPTNNVSYAFAGNIGALKYEDEKYEYKLLSMFGEVGSSPVAFDVSNFFFKRHYSDGNSSQYNGALLINSINAFATAVKSYRIKIIDKDPGAIYVLCGFKYQSGNWVTVTFSGVDDYFWAGIIYADDQAKLQELGLISDTSYPHDEILYSNAYNYECVAMYSDMGVTSVQFDPSNFYVDKATSYPAISIFSRAAFSTPVMTWMCRIAPNPEYIDVIVAFRWDTSNNEWMSVNFNHNPPDDNYWWGCLISSEDSEAVRKYGLKTVSADWFGQYGGFIWNDDYTFQAIEVYSELGQPVSGYDLTTLDCYSLRVGSLNKNVMAIRNLVKDTTNLKFWKCRIALRDTATGTIANIVLPTAHSGQYSSVVFNSLRYYAKGMLSNTGVDADTAYCGRRGDWYYGTLQWTDESLGDLSDKIAIQDPSALNIYSKQTVFRIIFISDTATSGWHPSDTTQETYGFISGYSYIGGVHTITLYYMDRNWIEGAYVGRIQFRYLDEVTKFKNLNAFDLIDVSSGTLSKATTTDRYDMYNVWNGDITVIAKYR